MLVSSLPCSCSVCCDLLFSRCLSLLPSLLLPLPRFHHSLLLRLCTLTVTLPPLPVPLMSVPQHVHNRPDVDAGGRVGWFTGLAWAEVQSRGCVQPGQQASANASQRARGVALNKSGMGGPPRRMRQRACRDALTRTVVGVPAGEQRRARRDPAQGLTGPAPANVRVPPVSPPSPLRPAATRCQTLRRPATGRRG